ncbi:MAG: type I-U CRISPR-associated helicase/endonuclease Cas3, partial [Planctomycetaceae bacterium]|nr:type I-U CRISPR-associated helicase/endonuclease Cas3 [Planctomycetaceae bacterium]
QRTRDLLQHLPKRDDGRFDAGPRALGELPKKGREAAFAPYPEFLPVSEILFDAWTLTTIRDELPGRPPVADWLHGVPPDWEPPQTSVAWREEVERLTEDVLRRQSPPLDPEELEKVLEAYPLKPHELLSDRTDRVFSEIKTLASEYGDVWTWIVSPRGKVVRKKLQEIVDEGAERLEHQTVLLPPSVGGLREGLLDGKAKAPEGIAVLDVADKWLNPAGQRRRVRLVPDPTNNDDRKQSLKDHELGDLTKWREVAKFELTPTEEELTDEEQSSVKVWYWFVRPSSEKDEDSFSRQAPEIQFLRSHLNCAKDYAVKIVAALQLPEPEGTAVIVAAELHDLGKDRKLWQHGIGNKAYDPTNPETIWAKSNNNRRPANEGYRHEFGTLLQLEKQDVFKNQPEDVQELIRHLIAAHHGRGRPHFPRDEAFDPEAYSRGELTQEGVFELVCEVPGRFARLQREYGRWGLAWLESLVRAADVMASRNLEVES